MLRSWGFFTFGGLFTALYSNAARRYPLMRKPMLHVTCTAVGFCVGYLAHRYEENSEQRVQRLMEKHRNVPPHDNWTQMARKAKSEASD
ncbi:hypothetical protein GBAR_LOCUS20764 [Geodia barretti]|uniref:Uncharacterized protein n=1 Tax=Geodia barretti TaxID=519541 RepID=A0AA35X3V9_GEOBA|nr:hypothetical protein GBAR_LOCUS20764 [Geodia barretti]